MITLKNKTTNEHVDFENTNGYILSSFSLGQASASRSTTQYIDLIGQNVDTSVIGVRDMTFTGAVKARNEEELRRMKNKLNKLVNPLQEVRVIYDGYYIDAMPDSTVVWGIANEEKGRCIHMFSITMTAYYPLFRDIASQRYVDGATQPVSLFPLIIPVNKGISFGYVPAITINNPVNEGDVNTGFVVRFTATDDGITNPKIENVKTGAYIEIMVNMLQGDIVEISTEAGNKYAKLIRGENETDLMNQVTNASTFDLTLNVGINEINITNSSGNVSKMTASLTYTPSFMEVR